MSNLVLILAILLLIRLFFKDLSSFSIVFYYLNAIKLFSPSRGKSLLGISDISIRGKSELKYEAKIVALKKTNTMLSIQMNAL